MSRRKGSLLAAAAAIALPLVGGLALAVAEPPAPAAAAAPVSTYLSLEVDVEARPAEVQPVAGDDGRTFVSYLLLVTNWLDEAMTLATIELVDETGRVVSRYDEAALEDPYRQRSTRSVEADGSPANRRLERGRTAIVQVGAAFDAGSTPPRAITHRITFEPSPQVRVLADDGSAAPGVAVSSEPLTLSDAPPPVLGPPLSGGPWRCGNGLAFDNAHMAFYAFRTARLRVPQRFGCDFAKVDEDGQTLPNPFPDVISNAMFYGHGAEVLAVADGRIAYVRDGIPENVPKIDGAIVMPVPISNDTVSGNWIALDLGGDRYAFYAHLQPGSITVRTGERVRRGQLLGRLGNSGNSVGPHLHFHVGKAPSLSGSDGMPYVFDCFEMLGRGKPQPPGAPGRALAKGRLPLANAIVRFASPTQGCGSP